MYDILEYRKDPRMPVISSPEMVVELSHPRALSFCKGTRVSLNSSWWTLSTELFLPCLQELTWRRVSRGGPDLEGLTFRCFYICSKRFCPNHTDTI